MAAKTKKLKKFMVRKEWIVTMECWVEVEAANATAACEIAMDTDDFDDQKIQDNSDGSTYIGAIEDAEGNRLDVPSRYDVDTIGNY